MAALPFVSGKDAVFRLFINGPEVILNAKTWSVKVNVTKYADGVNGEDRDRLGRIVNYFEISSSCFTNNSNLIDALLSDIGNDDSQVPPLVKAGGIRLKILDGTKVSYVAKELVIDDWDLNQSGRDQRVMVNLPIRFRYFDKAKSA